MKKIRISKRQFQIIVLAYRLTGFSLIMGLLLSYSIFVGKPIEFLLIFFPYFLSKGKYASQYHAKSMVQCMLTSVTLFALLTTFTLPVSFSIQCSGIFGVLTAYISYRVSDAQIKLNRYNALIAPKQFNADTCTKDELIQRCTELKFSKENTELAVMFFIDKTKQSIIADLLHIDEKSVTTRKKRMKAKLNQNS